MPVINSLTFNLKNPIISSELPVLVPTNLKENNTLLPVNPVNFESTFTVQLLTQREFYSNSFPLISNETINTSQSINLKNFTETSLNSFNLNNPTDVNQNFNIVSTDFNNSKVTNKVEPFEILIKDTLFFEDTEKNNKTTVIVTSPGLVTDSGILEQIDDIGPSIINTFPASGTILNDPNSVLKFRIQDNATTNISGNSINIFIDNIPYVTSGVVVQSNTFLSPISLREYEFEFTNPSGFNLGSTVTVSGSASDVLGNSSNFLYSYRNWDEEDLIATINPTPDIEAPYLFSSSPNNLETNVNQNTNINFLLKDDHTGIDINSLIVNINDNNVISGIQLNNNYATYDINYSNSNRELNIEIIPNDSLGFGQQVEVDISVSDLNNIPNTFTTSFSFETEINSYLIVSGLNIFSNGNFVPFNINDLFNSESPTDFYVDYINTSGTGIDINSSKVVKNGKIISSDFIPISGSNSHYRVFFKANPDYEMRSLLNFYIQAQGDDLPLGSYSDLKAEILPITTDQVSDLTAKIVPKVLFLDLIASIIGTESALDLEARYTPRTEFVFRNFTKEFLWGYEVCYSGTNLPYESKIQTQFSTQNQGCTTKKVAYTSSFLTGPFPNYDLLANIVPEGLNRYELSGYIESINPFFEYGKTMNMVLEVEDFQGNKLEYKWSFTIEDD